MKYTVIIASILMASCNHQPTSEQLLKNDESRHDIMQLISNDHAMAGEMINYLANSDASADLMKSNCDFMKSEKAGKMVKKDTALQNMMISNIFFMLNSDSTLCDKTCNRISQIPQIDSLLKNKRSTARK